MKIGSLICLAALLMIVQPVLAQEVMNKSCLPEVAVDLGEIGKQKFEIAQNGSLSPGELLWFKLKAVEPVSFFITTIDPEATFGLVVFDEAMNYVASGRDMLALSLNAGSYYARLDARPYEKVNYTFLASNNVEAEPNDGLTEANDLGAIPKRLLLGGKIEPAGDVDFFKLEAAEGGLLRIDSDGEEDMALVLYQYNNSKQLYLPEEYGYDDISKFLDPGSYYLRLENYGDQNEAYNYTLNLSLTPMTCDKEPNNSFEEAKLMGVLNASAPLVEKGCIESYSDRDYFKFEVAQNTSVAVNSSPNSFVYICLYDSNEKRVSCADYYGMEDGSASIESDLMPGIYYARVRADYGGQAYELSVEAK